MTTVIITCLLHFFPSVCYSVTQWTCTRYHSRWWGCRVAGDLGSGQSLSSVHSSKMTQPVHDFFFLPGLCKVERWYWRTVAKSVILLDCKRDICCALLGGLWKACTFAQVFDVLRQANTFQPIHQKRLTYLSKSESNSVVSHPQSSNVSTNITRVGLIHICIYLYLSILVNLCHLHHL